MVRRPAGDDQCRWQEGLDLRPARGPRFGRMHRQMQGAGRDAVRLAQMDCLMMDCLMMDCLRAYDGLPMMDCLSIHWRRGDGRAPCPLESPLQSPKCEAKPRAGGGLGTHRRIGRRDGRMYWIALTCFGSCTSTCHLCWGVQGAG